MYFSLLKKKTMKNEYQIIVRCKQPIEIENPLQCLLGFSFSVGERNILQTVSWSFFWSFYFSNALESDNKSYTVYVLEHNYVLGPSQS